MASSSKKEESVFIDLFQFQATAGLLAKYADRVFVSELDISQSQLAVLLFIDSLEPPVNQSRVSEKIQRGLNSTSMMVDRLKKQGLITRTRSDSDRRENYLELTQAGRDKVAKGKKISKLVARKLSSVLSDKEAQDLTNTLSKLEEYAMKEIAA
jgi:MarR family transcriptional regulator, organic hydroperoxide resistance regulator